MMEGVVMDYTDTPTLVGEMIRMTGTQLPDMCSYWLMPQSHGAHVNKKPPLKAPLKRSIWEWPRLEIKPRGIGCSWRKSDMISKIQSRYMEITRALLISC